MEVGCTYVVHSRKTRDCNAGGVRLTAMGTLVSHQTRPSKEYVLLFRLPIPALFPGPPGQHHNIYTVGSSSSQVYEARCFLRGGRLIDNETLPPRQP